MSDTIGELDKILKDIKSLDKNLGKKCDELTQKLADVGCEYAQKAFNAAIYHGNNDSVSVRTTGKGRSRTVEATGPAVLFIEFGTGVVAEVNPGDHPEGAEHGMIPGSWSRGPQGKGYVDSPDHGWWYGGQRVYGSPPNACMHRSKQVVRENFERLAKEVFGRD